MRIALGIEYDGSNYCGWQRQNQLPTIQSAVEIALSKIADCNIVVSCAGRTDTGVHALGQVIHFDTEAIRPDRAWVFGTNTHLPDDIRVQWVKQPVSPEFHARFSAISRHYRYLINNRKTPSALTRHTSTWYPYQLDIELMREAAQHLLGENDFTSFRGSGCQSKSPYRNVTLIEINRNNSDIVIDIKANAFLLHMVRNIVGLLLEIGNGQHPPTWAKEVLAAKNRTIAGITAPPRGLYLVAIEYPVISC